MIDAASKSSNQYPRQPITTFQTPSIDRLHGHLGLPFGDHDSQIAATPWAGALQVLGHGLHVVCRVPPEADAKGNFNAFPINATSSKFLHYQLLSRANTL